MLPRAFYARPTLEVARDLLGRDVVCVRDRVARAGRVVEVEAYIGQEDQACHASRGRTPRTAVMFGPPGVAYVYLIYGMHHCLNAVTESEGVPAAVLIRAVEPAGPVDGRTDGPGRLCRALHIDRTLNGADLTVGPGPDGETGAAGGLYFTEGDRPIGAAPREPIDAGPRIGVAYAGEWAQRPWRLWLRNSPCVSR